MRFFKLLTMTAIRESEPKLPVGVVIFSKDRSRVLLVQHRATEGSKAGLVGIPAGRPEAGERIKSTGVREVRQETGLIPSNLVEYPGNIYRGLIVTEGKRKRYALRALAALGYRGEERASEETEKPVWARIDTLGRRRNLMPSVEKIVFDALKVIS